MNNNIKQIIDYLKAQPENAVEWHDEPWMRFSAELHTSHDDPAAQALVIGYWREVGGDLIPDPQFSFDIVDGEVMRITMATMFHSLRVEEPEDVQYATQFLSVIWTRHFNRDRMTAEVTK